MTIGYWKNHDAHLAAVLSEGEIRLGDRTVRTVREALGVLGSASATDARDMLRAQLLATLLNLKNGSDPMQAGSDIRPITEQAVQFLATHTSPVTGGSRDRGLALSLKDKLDVYNNSKGNCGGDSDGEIGGGGGGSGGDNDECRHNARCRTKADCERRSKYEARPKPAPESNDGKPEYRVK